MVKLKTCSYCGTNFKCGMTEADNSCWCTALPNIVPMAAGGDCLCPDCLKGKIEEIQKGRHVSQFHIIKG